VLSLTVGENGLIKKSQKAGEEHKKAQIIEELELKIIDLQAEIYEKEKRQATLNDLKIYFEKQNYAMDIINEETTYGKLSYKGYEFVINEQLKITDSLYVGNVIQQLLSSIGEDKNKTLQQILKDENILNKIFTTDKAINIIINNKNEFLDAFINDSNAMNKIANSDKMMDKIVNNSDWSYAILNNKDALQALDNSNPITVPYMTSNNTPKGQVIYSSIYSSIHPAYYPFADTRDWESAYNGNPQYIGYMFEEPVWLYKCYIKNSNDSAPREMMLQKSDDGINWTNVFGDFTYVGLDKDATDIVNSKQNIGRAKYWRLYITKATDSRGGVDIQKIQFYGK